MNIVVAAKMVPDDQDIQITAAGDLDISKAHQTISAYDLNAIEAAAAKNSGDIDVERDIIANMGFRPAIADDVRQMDPALFKEEWDGLREVLGD